MASASKTYVVEHLDPELGPWSELEYQAIAEESAAIGASFCLSSVPKELSLPEKIHQVPGFIKENRSVEEIYASNKDRVCLLDPSAPTEMSPEDGKNFDIFLFGGILGDDPPRDRTSELRKKGYQGRRLGAMQMTTDTAVRVTRMIVQTGVALENIPYVDNPEIRIDEHESSEMPFRYVRDESGKPIMPRGMEELIKKDTEKGFGDLF